jgi:hypothetical protein
VSDFSKEIPLLHWLIKQRVGMLANHFFRPLGQWAVALAALGSALAAQAQTYVATELKKSRTGQMCYLPFKQNSAALLNAAGSVAGVCDFLGGYALDPKTLKIGRQRIDKPVRWKLGAAPQELAVPANTRFNAIYPSLSITDAGDLYTGSVYRTNWLGSVVGDLRNDQLPLVWKANKAALLKAPVGSTGPWSVEAISHGGAQLIFTTDGMVVVRNGQEVKLPPLPALDGLTNISMGNLVINDLGQVAVGVNLSRLEGIGVDARWVVVRTGAWLWTGSAWQAIEPPAGNTIKWIDAINNLGQVTGAVDAPPVPTEFPEARVEALRGLRFVWSVPTGGVLLPGPVAYRTSGRAAISEGGQVVGALVDQPSYANVSPRAALWQPGQAAVDLNSVTTLPSGVLLWYALAINGKGQILAQQGDYPFNPSYFVLTPR